MLRRAIRHHASGEAGCAEEIYRQVLVAQPDDPDANHLLGLIEFEKGNRDASIRLIERSIEVRPDFADAPYNLGIVLRAAGRARDAEASYRKAISVKPDHAEALNDLGTLMYEQGRLEEAAESLRQAISARPDYAEAHSNLGEVLREGGRLDDALASVDRAISVRPDYAAAHYNRGLVLRALERPAEAAESYRRALAIRPEDTDTLLNLAATLRALMRHEEALATCDAALAADPRLALAHLSRAYTLRNMRRYEEAIESLNGALAIDPDFMEALNLRGDILEFLHRYDEAIADLRRAADIEPDYRYNRFALLAVRQRCCEWTSFEDSAGPLERDVGAGRVLARPFPFFAFSTSPAHQLTCAENHMRDMCPPSPSPLWRGERYRHERIRVAYVSADFHAHPMAYLMAGLFERHDRDRFETIAFSFGARRSDAMRGRLESAFDRFIDVHDRGAEDIARLIRELEVDIAIDRKGFTREARPQIFALRPAPVQAQYLAYPGTMGAPYIDYILADRIVIPEDERRFYAEKVVYLPDTYQANDSARPIAERTPGRAEAGLPEAGFVFCSFNQNYKITPRIFGVWMRLLQQVHGSVLWLYEHNPTAARNLRREAAGAGVAPERLVFAPRVGNPEHLARHRLADVFLDTLPFNAHTTASDALWAGLPIVTCLGTTFAGRVAASLLNAVGLPELVTRSLEDYEALALRLARDRGLLAGFKDRLARNRLTHPLFDTDRMRRHIEAAYEAMWERAQRGEAPESFAVPAISPPP